MLIVAPASWAAQHPVGAAGAEAAEAAVGAQAAVGAVGLDVAVGASLPTAGPARRAAGCTLHLLEHRSGQELLRVPLQPEPPPRLQLGFTHSVLGTPVLDTYSWRAGGWHLTEEQFEGEGYGLPHAPAAGETLQRHGSGWRLLLDRAVVPLVVRPLPDLQMRLLLPDGRQWLLGTLTTLAVELTTTHC